MANSFWEGLFGASTAHPAPPYPFQQQYSNNAGAYPVPGSWTDISSAQQWDVAQMQASAPLPERVLRRVTTAHLAQPVFETSIETLVNAWMAHFGDGWVNREDIFKSEDAEFYEIAAQRLIKCGRLEEHTLSDTYATVYRVVVKDGD